MKSEKNKKNGIFFALRGFLALWLSQSISAVGTAMTNYALAVWVYGQSGNAMDVSLLTLSSFLPTIFFRFAAGAIADRWNKKTIMLAADLAAALGSLAILLLHLSGSLRVAGLYAISFVLSLMNAFQVPAAYVATSMLVPKEHYQRTGGLQAASGAAISILSPALAGIVMARGGLTAVLVIDLCTFAIAWVTLLALRIPKLVQSPEAAAESFWQNCLGGVRYLKTHPNLRRLILYIAAVNLLAKLGADGQMQAFVLSRENQTALGAVQTSVALGLMAGGMAMAARKPAADGEKAVYLSCCCVFLTGIGLALCRGPAGWCLFAFLMYLCAAVMNVHWDTLMRSQVPLEKQGRVYSARDTLQNGTIPLGLYLGAVLADHVFEPFMAADTPVQRLLAQLFGTGGGAGLALLFFLTSAAGLVLSLVCLLLIRRRQLSMRSLRRP